MTSSSRRQRSLHKPTLLQKWSQCHNSDARLLRSSQLETIDIWLTIIVIVNAIHPFAQNEIQVCCQAENRPFWTWKEETELVKKKRSKFLRCVLLRFKRCRAENSTSEMHFYIFVDRTKSEHARFQEQKLFQKSKLE